MIEFSVTYAPQMRPDNVDLKISNFTIEMGGFALQRLLMGFSVPLSLGHFSFVSLSSFSLVSLVP